MGREGDDRGRDGWMVSLTRWTWFWVGSGSWWWTRKPGMLQSMGSQGVRRNWATELNGTTFLHLDSCNTIYQTEQGSTKKSSILFKTTKQENNWVGTELSSDSKAVYSVISGLLNLDTITTWQPDNPLLSVCPTSYILECLAATWTYTNQLPVAISICGSQNFL